MLPVPTRVFTLNTLKATFLKKLQREHSGGLQQLLETNSSPRAHLKSRQWLLRQPGAGRWQLPGTAATEGHPPSRDFGQAAPPHCTQAYGRRLAPPQPPVPGWERGAGSFPPRPEEPPAHPHSQPVSFLISSISSSRSSVDAREPISAETSPALRTHKASYSRKPTAVPVPPPPGRARPRSV